MNLKSVELVNLENITTQAFYKFSFGYGELYGNDPTGDSIFFLRTQIKKSYFKSTHSISPKIVFICLCCFPTS